MNGDELADLKRKFEQQIQKELKDDSSEHDLAHVDSSDYQTFRKQYMPKHQSWFEKACNISGKVLNLKPTGAQEEKLQSDLETAHIQTTPTGAMSFAILIPLCFMLLTVIPTMFLINSMYLGFFFLMLGGMGIMLFLKLPAYFADMWRMKASNQMVLAIFYIVTYMRHTSNMERAVEFAAHHLSPPMSLDLQKVIWDVETERFSNVRESMDSYLETWQKHAEEFVESMYLIEGSLYEDSEERRLESLDKALDVILNQTYEKMLHYAHNLHSPITTLHMLGIILPILGLVIMPLLVSFMDGTRWYHISSIYNLGLPLIVFIMGKNILSKRPTGYGASDMMDQLYNKQESKKFFSPKMLAISFFILFLILGLSPLWLPFLNVPDFGFGDEVQEEISVCGRMHCFFDYHVITKEESPDFGKKRGPFGLGSAVVGLLVPMAMSFSLAIYYSMRTKGLLEVRERTQQLEKEFGHALFTLGNRIGDGIPPEMAFGRVAETMLDTDSGKFMMMVSYNIQKMGMSVEQAIFDPQYGAIKNYPSSLIESSMKVLIQSAKKGPYVAAQALMNISRYMNEVHKVNERLQDLMGEVISSMKSQINFLTPIIAGIVIGITSMISHILSKLSGTLTQVTQSTDSGGVGVSAGSGLLNMFGEGIPTYYFQLIVGVYVVQIIYILTILVNGIESGVDPLNEKYLLGKNMLKAAGLYLLIAGSVMILFNVIAGSILTSIA
ncbi:MAG: hypothetical protein ACOCWQ_01580 [Nanoarchaeota archaeon]